MKNTLLIITALISLMAHSQTSYQSEDELLTAYAKEQGSIDFPELLKRKVKEAKTLDNQIDHIVEILEDFEIYVNIDTDLDLVEWRISKHYIFMLKDLKAKALKIKEFEVVEKNGEIKKSNKF